MKLKWNTNDVTYHAGRVYRDGDKIPASVVKRMGEETVAEYLEKGWLAEDVESEPEKDTVTEPDEDTIRDELFSELKELGLKPHHNAGLQKLQEMKNKWIDDQKGTED